MGLLEDDPVLLLFVVVAAGVLGGRVRVRGLSLGVEAVLFAGIAFGAAGRRRRPGDHDVTRR